MKIYCWIFLLFVSGNLHAEMYRSVDRDGKVQYSDLPIHEGNTQQLRFGKGMPQEVLPYVTREAAKKNPVTLYVSETCGAACANARALLNKRGVPYAEKNLVNQADIEAFKQSSGGDRVPALLVGNSWQKGFLEEAWQQALDVAGYPKVAPYGVKPKTLLPPTTVVAP